MEKIFRRNNIGIQRLKVEEHHHPFFAYTDKLLELGVLIEFYTVEIEEDEEETVVLANTYTKDCSYSFALFHTYDVFGAVPLYRIIADAIAFIEKSTKETLLDDLEDISTGDTTSDTMDNAQDRKRVYESDVWKFNAVVEAIRVRRKFLN